MNIQYCLPGSCSLGGSLTDDCLSGLAVKLKWQGAKLFFTHKRTLLKVHYSATLVHAIIQRVDIGLFK